MEKKVSKVNLNGETLIDIHEDTVTPETLLKNETSHKADGNPIVGTAEFGGDTTDCYKITDPVGSEIADSDYFPFNDVSDSENPKKKTLFSTIISKLKDTFLTKKMQNNTNDLVQAASTLNLRMNTIDASKADNDVSAATYPSTFVITDKEDRTIGRVESVVRPDGNIGLFMYVRNYDTNGDAVAQNGIKFEMNKSGELEYLVGDADRFNANLGFGYAEGTVTGTAITATITNFRLVKNGIVVLKLSSGMPANATLNINNSGAKPIYWENGTATRAMDMSSLSNSTWLLMFDGSHFLIVGVNKAATITAQSYVANTSGNVVLDAYYGSNAFQFKYNLATDSLRWNRFINGAWHGDAEIIDSETLKNDAYSLKLGSYIDIAENTDLNTLTTPGTYVCRLAATAATLVNCPWTSSSFKMVVDTINNANTIFCQTITMQNDTNGFIYRRIKDIAGTWGMWQPVISEVSYGKTIPDNADLNDYKDIGVYNIASTTSAATMSNIPLARAGKLIVMNVAANNYRIQQFLPYHAPFGTIFQRTWRDETAAPDTWSDWYRIGGSEILDRTYATVITSGDLDDYKTPGLYMWVDGSYPNITHTPPQRDSYMLWVMDNMSTGLFYRQIAFRRGDATIYSRISKDVSGVRTWQDWQKLASDVDVQVKTYIGTCTTAADQQIKAATVDDDFVLRKGVRVGIKFSNTNTYSATSSNPIKLNVNNTGDKQIYYGSSATPTGTNAAVFGSVNHYIYYVYDGTYWVWDGHGSDNNNVEPRELGFGVATCSTAAATAAKVVDLSSYVLRTGGFVTINFQYDVPADATLNINNRGAKNIRYNGSNIKANIIFGGDRATFVYDGTQYVLVAIDRSIIGRTLMGTCATAADQQNKVATVDGDFVLRKGVRVGIKFSNTNTFSSQTSTPITLNVNNTGAKNIYYNQNHSGAGNTGTNSKAYGAANRYNYYVYDGTYWVWDGWSIDDNTVEPRELGFGYATCDTAAATAAKVATLSSYVLRVGGYVTVYFLYDVPANATLNINSRGAKNIWYKGANIIAGKIRGGDRATFIYDGTRYQLVGIDSATPHLNNLISISDCDWGTTLKSKCTMATSGGTWSARMINDNFLYVSVETSYTNAVAATIPSYGQTTTDVFFRIKNKFKDILSISEVMVDFNGVVYPAFAGIQTVDNVTCLVVALRKAASLAAGNGNIRFTFVIPCKIK